MAGSCDSSKVTAWRELSARFDVSELKTAEFCSDEG